ncbi:MAG: hypothetical protein QOF78_4108 [Phycisphaerales bacterium]|jgi:hypothetical protein|nr:hypothetical protein [Phycisphaerales bacterium]
MTDPIKRLEAELASLRPSPLSSKVVDAIADELADPPLRFADRCLLAAMGAGSLAACVIVGLVVWQIAGSEPRASAQQQILAVQTPPMQPLAPATLGEYQQALARSSDAVPEIFR